MIRMLLAFAYQAGPVDDFVRFIERNPWRAITILNLIFLVGLAWTVYVTAGTRLGVPYAADVTGTGDTILPTTGEQGFNVEGLCDDRLTTVDRAPFAPTDSPFAASYTLSRTKDGVHETVIVNVYPDPERQPVGVYGENQDAFVSRKAMECVERRAR